jgi:hypothetical protein
MTSIRVVLSTTDSDNDGILDADELALGLNPNNPVDALEDFDRDNLSNLDESLRGTNLRDPDSDDDDLMDGREVSGGTNPLRADTDNDLIPDGVEVTTNTDPLDPNSYDLRAATASSMLAPPSFQLTTSVLFPNASAQLSWKVGLIDGKTILDLTNSPRTSFNSSDLNVCSFGAKRGEVFAGAPGQCVITISQNTLSVTVPGLVQTFTPGEVSSLAVSGAVVHRRRNEWPCDRRCQQPCSAAIAGNPLRYRHHACDSRCGRSRVPRRSERVLAGGARRESGGARPESLNRNRWQSSRFDTAQQPLGHSGSIRRRFPGGHR